jgi:hypothetical protein
LASRSNSAAPYSGTPCVAFEYTLNEDRDQRVESVRYGRIQETGGFDAYGQLFALGAV